MKFHLHCSAICFIVSVILFMTGCSSGSNAVNPIESVSQIAPNVSSNPSVISVVTEADPDLPVHDVDNVFGIGGFQFEHKYGTGVTFQIKEYKEVPADKPYLVLTFYNSQNKPVYTQSVSIHLYPLVNNGVQTWYVKLNTDLPDIDASKITAELTKQPTITKYVGEMSPISNSPTYFMNTLMTDGQHGWAAGDATVLRTEDGGKTWMKTTPKELLLYGAGSSIASHVTFFKGNNAWIVKPAEITIFRDVEITVWHTKDGGKTWARSSLPLTEKWEQNADPNVVFTDVQHGFIRFTSYYVDGNHTTYYSTQDGGDHWALSSEMANAPSGSMPQFTDANNAWVSSNKLNESDRLFHTNNGGKTWREQLIDIPASYRKNYLYYFHQAPIFPGTNTKKGFLYVDVEDSHTSTLLLYNTYDGGMTWNYTGIAPANPCFLNDNLGLAMSRVKNKLNQYLLYVTKDGGKTWSLQNKTQIFNSGNLRLLNFINEKDGWISDIYPGNMYVTHDSGKTWSLIRYSSKN